MNRRFTAAAVFLAASGLFAQPAMAETITSPILTAFNTCAAKNASFRVCASAEVFITDNNVLNFRVWNMNGFAQGQSYNPTSTAQAYNDPFGGWHTIAAVGISNINFSMVGPANLSQAIYYANGTTRVLQHWGTDADAKSLQIYNTGAGATGHKQGIVGCLDPDRSPNKVHDHVSTCASYPDEEYVLFRITGFQTISLDGATFEFHGLQVASANCDPQRWSDACTVDSLKGSGAFDIPDQPVPEPMTLLLLGSGLVGVAGVARRRRRFEDTTDA